MHLQFPSQKISLTIRIFSDYQFLSTAGSSTSFASSIYSPGLYQGFKAKVTKSTAGLAVGSHSYKLNHSATGATNIISFIKTVFMYISITSTWNMCNVIIF